MATYTHLSIAIPMMDELENIPTLLQMLRKQTIQNFSIYICINQPEAWWNGNEEEQRICKANNDTLNLFKTITDLDIQIIDHCTPSHGWNGKKKGVGWARKELFSLIASQCSKNELIVSLDADTTFNDDYFEQLLDSMNQTPKISAIAVPYYHPLSENELLDRCMLRYECYMRYYLINLLQIDNPYAFSALGSAMVFPLWAYNRVGGITPLQGGEDFYLMQKFCKTGRIKLDINTIVKPQGRISHRVPFGTGPAVAAGLAQQAEKYPFFAAEGFEAIKQTFDILPTLYEEDKETPMTHFLKEQLHNDDLWLPLRKNFKTRELFLKGCYERVDGLRILQYLKLFPTGENNFIKFLSKNNIQYPNDFNFENSTIEELNTIRDNLFNLELKLRKEYSSQKKNN